MPNDELARLILDRIVKVEERLAKVEVGAKRGSFVFMLVVLIAGGQTIAIVLKAVYDSGVRF